MALRRQSAPRRALRGAQPELTAPLTGWTWGLVLVVAVGGCATLERELIGEVDVDELGFGGGGESQQSSPDALADALDVDEDELSGDATWYGERHHGRTTASGEAFDMYAYTAAHRTLPFGTRVRVTRVDTRQSVVVVVNDRGPYGRGRVIDLSRAAAEQIDLIGPGHRPVELEIVALPE